MHLDPSGSHKPDKCQTVGMVNICKYALKIVIDNKAEMANTLEPKKVMEVGATSSDLRPRDPYASRSIAGT